MKNKPYTALGGYYDRLISGYPYEKVTDKLKKELFGKGFDLGSGSGIITVELEKSGLSVIGVEESEEMLEKARERARAERVNPVFVKSDLNSLDFTRCDFVIATCDVFNYLPSLKAFERLLTKIYQSLKEGGKLVFDIRRGDILNNMKGEVYFEDLDNLTYLWSNTVKGDKLLMDIAFFERKEDNTYIRFDERHEWLIMPDDKVIEVVEKIGFKVKAYGDGLGKRKPTDKRLFLFCDKE